MSSSDKAFNFLKTVFTVKEQLDGMNRDMAALGDRIGRLSDSHVALRDRVSQIEGYLKAATGTPFGAPAPGQIEGPRRE